MHLCLDAAPCFYMLCGTSIPISFNICIKDHVHSSINVFRERIRAITNPIFVVGRLN